MSNGEIIFVSVLGFGEFERVTLGETYQVVNINPDVKQVLLKRVSTIGEQDCD